MARIFLDSNLKTTPVESLPTAVETIFQQFEDQHNAGSNVVGILEGEALPQGLQARDVVMQVVGGVLKVGIFDGKYIIYTP